IAFSLIMNLLFSEAGNRIFKLKYKGSFVLMNSFSNAGFLGLPICWILFGDIGLFYWALYILIESLLHYSLGIFASVYSESGKLILSAKKVGRFPAFWILGTVFLFIISGINIPPQFTSVLEIISKLTLGMAVFYIGSNIVKPENIHEFFNECSYVAIFRFLISPLIILFPLLYFGVEYYYILVLEAMMPPAIGNTIVAGYYKLNEKLCANITITLIMIFLSIFFILSGFFAIIGIF
ncbi:MAG: AEC family transporter, partial [Candidatus Aenigmarchaeota archaeon]|nr:AEC family transporter [Candidatus Aenigmarchaeota archaeon]